MDTNRIIMKNENISPLRRLSVKDLSVFYVVSLGTALNRKKEILSSLAEKGIIRDYVTLQDLANHEGYTLDYLFKMLFYKNVVNPTPIYTNSH